MTARSPNFAPRRAFTLVEMLLATTLLALLMVGLLAVITDFTASAQALQLTPLSKAGVADTTPHPDDQTLAAFARLLEDDLAHAQSVDTDHDNQLLVTGYSSLRLDQGPRSHRPVQTVYSLENVGGQELLIRRQMLLDIPSNQNVRRDLVLCGIRRFAVSRDSTNVTRDSSATVPTTQNAENTKPGRWILRLWAADQSTPVFERFLNLPTGVAL